MGEVNTDPKKDDKIIDGQFKEQPQDPEAGGTRALALRNENVAVGLVQDPEVVLQQAQKAAAALKKVIDSKPKPVKFNNEIYLESEDWILIGEFYGGAAKIVADRPITREVTEFDTGTGLPVGTRIARGWEADAVVIDKRTGAEIGSAGGECLDDEENWGARPKYEWYDAGKQPQGAIVVRTVDGRYGQRVQVQVGFDAVPDFQRRSMAQTRAASRALALRYRFVPILAGYKGTPAEELRGVREERGHEPSGAPEPATAPQAARPAPQAAPQPVRVPWSEEHREGFKAIYKAVNGERAADPRAQEAITAFAAFMNKRAGGKWENLWANASLTAEAFAVFGIDDPGAAPKGADPDLPFDPDAVP